MEETKSIQIKMLPRLLVTFFLLAYSINAVAQQRTISGTVYDESGVTLPGVSIVIKETTIGTVTGADGAYTLAIPDENVTLVFSYLGFLTEEIEVGSRSIIDANLTPSIQTLSEMVVVGYGTQRKATLTGSTGTVSSTELSQRPAANTTDLLQGRVSGLITRQASGLPGSDGVELNIRGFGNPLVLVNGVESSLAQVDPNDIESISVLRDASAAVYGARAGNGVILVTTKRGTNMPSQITYHATMSVTQPTFRANLVNAQQWAELMHETGQDPNVFNPRHINYDPETNRLINTLDGSDFAGYDWANAIWRDWVPQQQHNINARGGTDRVRYFVSAGITDQKSNFQSGDFNFNRYNIRSNIDANITDNLVVSFDFGYRTTILDRANVDVDELFNSINHAKPVFPVVHEQDPSRATYPGDIRTPYHQSFKDFSGFFNNRSNNLLGMLALKYDFPMVEGLAAKIQLSYEEDFSWRKQVSNPYTVWEYDHINARDGLDPWIDRGVKGNRNIWVYSDRATELMPLASLEYKRSFGNHNLSGILVSETRTYKWTSLRGDRRDLLSFEAPLMNFASNEGKDNAENLVQRARTGIISRVNYDYAGKYMLEVAMRADASAEYPSVGRWGYFPSFNAGWRMSEEAFLKNRFDNLDNLKIRGSHGMMGFDAISSFAYLAGYEITGDYFVFGNSPAPEIRSMGLPNPNITWEIMTISNIGIDGAFWGGMLEFEVDAFYRLRENILAAPTAQVPNTFGASLPLTNLNKRDNRGFEVTLTHNNRIGDFSYTLAPMFSWSRGKFVELSENVLPITDDMDPETREFNRLWNNRYVRQGQWDDRLWGFVFDGYFLNQDQIDNHTVDQDQSGNQTIRVGDIIYRDLNGDGVIDWRDQAVIGTTGLPNVMYSMNMGLAYKNFSLSMLWQGASHYTVEFRGAAMGAFSNETMPLEHHYLHRAIVGVDENGQEFITNPDDFKLPPLTSDGLTDQNSRTSAFTHYDARFIRLRNLHVAYSLPKEWTNRAGINNLEIYANGTNLLTFSNLGIFKNSFDPEITVQANRRYPPVKTVTFGFRLTI